LRQFLEPSSQVRRLAVYRLLLCRPLTNQLANDDEAGRDANPTSQWLGACLGLTWW
jgi:hypothetical protein